MPAQHFAVAHLVDVILCVPMLLDVDMLPGATSNTSVSSETGETRWRCTLPSTRLAMSCLSPVFIKSARTENHTSLPIGTCLTLAGTFDV